LAFFDINMPLLYGEGARAFIRLQEEIMKISDDKSLFAWRDPTFDSYRDDYPEASKPQGLLAASPGLFQHSDTIAQFYSETPGRAVSVSTNKGLQVDLLMCQDLSFPSGQVYMAVLDCQIGKVPGLLAGIRLRRLSSTGEQYARIDMSQLFQFASYTTQNRIDFQGFNPTKPQHQLIETNFGRPVLPIFRLSTFLLMGAVIRHRVSRMESKVHFYKTRTQVSIAARILACAF
jgi:hypothetical protein